MDVSDDAAANALQARARADVYHFFSGLTMGPPTRELPARIRAPGFLEDLAESFGERAVEPLREFIDLEDGLDRATRDYEDLFQVPLGRYVTPYEAVFCDTREVLGEKVGGLMMGPSTLAVKSCYEQAGVRLDDKFLEHPDHIAAELEFMSLLCAKEGEFLEAGDLESASKTRNLQSQFLGEHVLRWIPHVCGKIQKRAQTGLWRAVGAMLEAYLDAEKQETGATTVETKLHEPKRTKFLDRQNL